MKNQNLTASQQQKENVLRVLIADDDPPTRILLKTAISRWGYSAVEASDGEEAWFHLQQSSAPQLVILDWLMPKIDGIDLCKRIQCESSVRPYIILLTQVTGTENIIKGLESGADEFLSKPFNMAELRSRLTVGSRIIKYKLELDERYKQLLGYIYTLEYISTISDEMTDKMNNLILEASSLEETKKNTKIINDLDIVNEKLKRLTDVIEQFKLTSEKLKP